MRYVLEGSLRKSVNCIRVTAQLVEAATGNHVWAERYGRGLADIFAVQDEITEAVAIANAPAIADAEARTRLGMTLWMHADYAGALAEVDRALAISRTWPARMVIAARLWCSQNSLRRDSQRSRPASGSTLAIRTWRHS